MRDFVLQPWTTVQLGASMSRYQHSEGYLDLADFEDIVLYTDVRETGGSLTLNYQSSATIDGPSFQTILAISPTATPSPRVDPIFGAYAGSPLLRYLRWALTSTASTDITFRIHVAAYAPGA